MAVVKDPFSVLRLCFAHENVSTCDLRQYAWDLSLRYDATVRLVLVQYDLLSGFLVVSNGTCIQTIFVQFIYWLAMTEFLFFIYLHKS